MLLVWDWDEGGGVCLVGCSGDAGLVSGVWRLLNCEVRGSCTCSRSGVVSEVEVMGRAGRYRGVEDEGRSISSGVLLGFHRELNFFIVCSWYSISCGVYLCSSFASITCSWMLSPIAPPSLGTNTPFFYKKLWKSCTISFFIEAYIFLFYLIKSSLIYSYSAVLLYLLSL